MLNYKKDDFFMTGSTQSALIYNYTPGLGALKLLGDDIAGILFYENNVVSYYFDKKGITACKNKLMKKNIVYFEKRFLRWQAKWQKKEPLIYKLATKGKNWRKNWERLEKLSYDYWKDTYFLDTYDHFAEEFDQQIIKALKKAKLDPELRNELVLPDVATKVQEVAVQLQSLKDGQLSKTDFLRKYWYSHGSWNGGEILTEKLLDHDLATIDIDLHFKTRKKIHEEADPKLDKKTLNLVKVLRFFALWRDERKAVLQMISLGFRKVALDAAKELKVDPKVVEFSFREEIDEIPNNPQKFLERKNKSVLLIPNAEDHGQIVVGAEAEPYFQEFMATTEVKEIKGIVASPGKVQGIANVILRQHQFFEFNEGDILVTMMTRPEFMPLMKKASAIITDEGGLTCHAAIVSRELKKPCIVGTKEATRVLKTGDKIEVDADKGIIRKI
jgi:phosphohistidine swiveling domain-containing protein